MKKRNKKHEMKKKDDTAINKIISISKEFDAKRVFIFGSYLTNIKLAGDIDIAVEGVSPKKFFEMYGKIISIIDNKVDIVPLEDAREHFANRILEKGKLVYEKKV